MLKKLISQIKTTAFTRAFLYKCVPVALGVICMALLAFFTSKDPDNAPRLCLTFAALYLISVALFIVIRSVTERQINKKAGGEIEPLVGNMTLELMHSIYMPMIICDMNGKMLWFNRAFGALSGTKSGFFGKNIKLICGVPLSHINSSDAPVDGIEATAFDTRFKIKGYPIQTAEKRFCITVWNDISSLDSALRELNERNTVIAYITVDNLEELLSHIQDKYREVTNEIASILGGWAESVEGVIKEFQRDRYIFMFHEKYLPPLVNSKFAILDSIRNVRVGAGSLPVTVSIGISACGDSLAEREKNAQAALDMALQRGGDQAVIKEENDMKIFGGRTQSVQKRTKVRSRVTANELVTLIAESGNVLIMGHVNPDYDCFGADIGVARIAKFCGNRVNIVIDREDRNIARCFDYLASLQDYEHLFVSPHEALDLVRHDTLLVIVDVNNPKQFQAPELAENVDRIVYIDHHRKTTEFKTKPLIAYIEPSASSACELVAELLEQTLTAGMLPHEEANLLLAGIMLDTKQFTKNTGVRTFGAGFYLQNEGANPQTAQVLFKSELDELRREASFESNVKIYKGIYAITTNTVIDTTSDDMRDRVAAAKAADKLLSVDKVEASFAICSIEGTVYISARSAGKVNVQVILEKLGGGGRFDAAATQLKETRVSEALELLKGAIDEYSENS